MIHLPFEDRIILIGARWQGDNPKDIKEHMKRFQFSPEPIELRRQYTKLMECAHDGFGCIAAASIKAGRNNMFTADWVAGGNVNGAVFQEDIPEYNFPDGRLQSIYEVSSTNGNPKYFAFMTGVGTYIGDLEDCFGSKEVFKELILAHKNAEITERVIAMLKSGGNADDYIELDDFIL
jgi:hypothetical protein